jgi:hypothetical protein
MPTVEILYFAGCPSYRKARENALRAIAAGGVEAKLKMTLVRHARDASALDFHGSPTVRIDGTDIDPEGLSKAPEVGLLSRGYTFERRTFAEPPEAMIREALLRAAAGPGEAPR